MREIKYRGKVDGKWWYVTPDRFIKWKHFWAEVDRKTVGQFAVLPDTRGKEIYEGDIVYWEGAGRKFTRPVRWDEDEAMFLPNDMKGEVEVIGNIHDNSELLREKPKEGK